MKIRTFLFALFLLVSATSCKKEGPQGPAGKDGNANVHGQVFTVSNWSYSAPSYYSDISYSAITQDIINTGAVLVYLSNGSGGYSQLPLTYYPSSAYSRTFETVSYPGGVRIYVTDSDLTQPVTPGTSSFKVVAISSSARIAHPEIDYSDYEEVAKVFHLTL